MSRTEEAPSGSREGWWARLTRSRSEEEAAHLQQLARQEADPQAQPICACVPGESVVVRGIVRSVVTPPAGASPAVEIELDDGSGSLRVIWLGRRRIPGVDAGRSMVVRGRLTCHTDHPTIYNPRYELKPLAG